MSCPRAAPVGTRQPLQNYNIAKLPNNYIAKLPNLHFKLPIYQVDKYKFCSLASACQELSARSKCSLAARLPGYKQSFFSFLNNLTELRILKTFRRAKTDHQWVNSISLKTITRAPVPVKPKQYKQTSTAGTGVRVRTQTWRPLAWAGGACAGEPRRQLLQLRATFGRVPAQSDELFP